MKNYSFTFTQFIKNSNNTVAEHTFCSFKQSDKQNMSYLLKQLQYLQIYTTQIDKNTINYTIEGKNQKKMSLWQLPRNEPTQFSWNQSILLNVVKSFQIFQKNYYNTTKNVIMSKDFCRDKYKKTFVHNFNTYTLLNMWQYVRNRWINEHHDDELL